MNILNNLVSDNNKSILSFIGKLYILVYSCEEYEEMSVSVFSSNEECLKEEERLNNLIDIEENEEKSGKKRIVNSYMLNLNESFVSDFIEKYETKQEKLCLRRY